MTTKHALPELRAILHSDCNSFYASVEQCEHPELRDKPVVVAGREDIRHGIVLTKSKEAKKYGIKTAEALWQARQKCPDLIVVPPNYPLYMKYSRMAHHIYYQYTPRVEPFGLDECWLDVTKTLSAYCNDPLMIAEEISERIKAELGITVSIGVSWNKIFAKFGSDYKKPDAITNITPENYKDIVWSSPAEDLIYVGQATARKLAENAIRTIGDLANASNALLQNRFGKIGPMLRSFARGEDPTPVREFFPEKDDVFRTVKSFGNGLTAPHDITRPDDARALLMLLSESVAQRLRESKMCASCISLGVRSGDLSGYTRQKTLMRPSNLTSEIFKTVWELLTINQPISPYTPIRALHVRASRLNEEDMGLQLDLFGEQMKRTKERALEESIDALRARFGNRCIKRGAAFLDEAYEELDIKQENVIHPIGFLGQ